MLDKYHYCFKVEPYALVFKINCLSLYPISTMQMKIIGSIHRSDLIQIDTMQKVKNFIDLKNNKNLYTRTISCKDLDIELKEIVCNTNKIKLPMIN